MTDRVERHIQIMVAHLVRGDQLMALRYYTEHRISRKTFDEARRRAATFKQQETSRD